VEQRREVTQHVPAYRLSAISKWYPGLPAFLIENCIQEFLDVISRCPPLENAMNRRALHPVIKAIFGQRRRLDDSQRVPCKELEWTLKEGLDVAGIENLMSLSNCLNKLRRVDT
jgi:hypothetical protein